MNTPRHRPLAVGSLRAFEAVARRTSFSAAAAELHLSQPAISRQIRGLEDEIGLALFLRGTRHVELTAAGGQLLRSVAPLLGQLDTTVRQLRSSQRRQPVGVSTFASFASMWLLPRLPAFQAEHPQLDIRISADDAFAAFDEPDIDLALRHCHPDDAPAGAVRLFGEVLTPVASPALLQRLPLHGATDLARHTLLEEDDHKPSAEFVSWHYWLRRHAPAGLEPRSWISLNFTYQRIQAAIAGQGVALARLALTRDALERGELVEPFGAAGRLSSPFAYWLVRWPVRQGRPALAAFEAWLLEQAAATRDALHAAPGGEATAPAQNSSTDKFSP
ncbi:LysR family transcriptional regulator [Rubrivivax sp. A210]|uniref:LysR substrate-binding domain-containing protein n=1 Tax=Rubrivivax sp. A210 TaxID=2772301 RepID=UPI0019195874|nr:LysR substrate-binding domain-containing protein [Rubrivivax sp. A210]CAD5374198.1 LysR family transcriptional regulator [Rubrivivax sp. A210]